MAYDGEIRIKTKVDTSQMQRLQVQIDKATNKVAALSAKYEELKNKKVPTDQFISLENKLKSTQAELDKLIAEENRLADAGLTIGAPWENVIQKEADARLKIEEITASMQKLKDEGKAFTLGNDPEEIKKVSNDLGLANAELRALLTKQNELNGKTQKVSDTFKKMGESAKKAFSGVDRHVRKSSGLFSTFASRLKGILLSLLIFNWITKGFNAMVSGMKTGFKNLVQYSDEYNRSASRLMSANTQMKNSLATAFAPIIQAVVPHLVTLINYVTAAANSVSMFFAVISGKSSWIKATAVQEDYADSLNGTAAAAKKAAGALASFDTLEVLNKKDASGGGAGTGTKPEDMFEEVPIESNGITEFAEQLRDWLNKLREAAEPAIDAFKRLWDEGLSKLKDFAFDTLLDLYNDFLVPVGLWVLGEGLPRFFDITNALLNEIDWTTLREALDRFYKVMADLAIITFDALLDFYDYFLRPLAVWTMSVAVPQLLDILSDFVEKVDWERLNKSLEDFWKAIEPYAENFGQGLINFFSDLKDIGIDLMNKVPGALDLLAGALNNGDPDKAEDWGYALGQVAAGIVAIKLAVAGFAVAKGLYEFFDKVKIFGEWLCGTWLFKKIGELVTAFAGLGPGITQALSYLNPGMLGEAYLSFERFIEGTFFDAKRWKGIPRILNDAAFDVVNEIGENIILPAFMSLGDFIAAGIELVSNALNWDWSFGEDGFFARAEECFYKVGVAFENQDWAEIGANIVEGIINGFFGAHGLVIEPIANFFTDFKNAICEKFDMHSPAKTMYPLGEYILLGIVEGFRGAFVFLTEALNQLWEESIKPWFSLEKWAELGQGILDGVSEKWTELSEWWNINIASWWDISVAPWFTLEKWQTLGENMKRGIYNGFSGIVNKIVDILNSVIGGVEDFINKIIEKINELIDKIKSSMGAFAPPIGHIGSIEFGRIPQLKIPALAQGAVIRGGDPFMAILGDQRAGQTNIEAPAGLIKDMTKAGIAESGIIGALQNMGNQEARIVLDGETVGRTLFPHLLNEWHRAGYNLEIL